MSEEQQPLLSPNSEPKKFVNPTTGSTENLNQITNYMPIDSDEIESLEEHQHDRSCNIDVLAQRRRKGMMNFGIIVSMTLYFVVFLLEYMGIVEVPYGFIIGIMCILGGLMGFLRKGSRPSLISGAAVGFLYLSAGYLTYTGSKKGYKIGFVVSLALCVMGAVRSYLTRFQSTIPFVLIYLGVLSAIYYGHKEF